MASLVTIPRADELAEVLEVLASWQIDDTAMQLHPGDIGWEQRRGVERTARAVRVWRRDGHPFAIGMFEEPGGEALLRLAIAPRAQQDTELTHSLTQELAARGSGARFPQGMILELPTGVLLRDQLDQAGWLTDEEWTMLQRDLAAPVEDPGFRVEIVGPELADARVEIHRASFPGSLFTRLQWDAMREAPGAERSRCLLGFDASGEPVAATTVWTAGRGLAGVIEPLGVAHARRGHGYGTAITRAAMAMLRELGASRALVCTPTQNAAGVAAYLSAGFTKMTPRTDLRSTR